MVIGLSGVQFGLWAYEWYTKSDVRAELDDKKSYYEINHKKLQCPRSYKVMEERENLH